MNNIPKRDWYIEVALEQFPGYEIIPKFGATLLTTTLRPITLSGTYMMPTAPVSLEFVSSLAADGVGGIGALEIEVTYINSLWDKAIQTFATNGLTAVPLPVDCLRLLTWKVSSSGTYATTLVGSHQGVLTIREAGGGATWDTIPIIPFALGRSQIGFYTIPRNRAAVLLSKNAFSETSKTADIYLFQRDKADTIVAPFDGIMTLLEREVGFSGGFDLKPVSPKMITLTGPTDIGFMGKVSVGTDEASSEFEILEIVLSELK